MSTAPERMRSKAAPFLRALLGCEKPEDAAVTFQVFDDEKPDGRSRSDLTRIFHGTLREHWRELERLNQAGTGIVTFGPPTVEQSFHTVANFYPPTLTAESDTPMGAALNQAVDLVESRKAEYRANGISFYRPWIFLITDGAPTDDWRSAAARIREGEASKKFALFAVGVEEADFNVLRQIAVREPLRLDGLKFRELFQWLSNSMKSVSQSTPGIEVKLESPAGWAQV